jgi:hypothetical protein
MTLVYDEAGAFYDRFSPRQNWQRFFEVPQEATYPGVHASFTMVSLAHARPEALS